MTKDRITQQCFTCGKSFDFGHGKYYGHFIKKYQFSICDMCYAANHNGYAPHLEAKIKAHLKENNLPFPKLNDEGFIPRE